MKKICTTKAYKLRNCVNNIQPVSIRRSESRETTTEIMDDRRQIDKTIMAKIYDGILILAELLLVIVKILYYICESTCKLFLPMEKKSVAGEIVLVTGAGHGIGKELAIGYASLGATVVCWDVDRETNERTVNEVKEMGINSIYAYRCDVANREQVFKVAETVKREVGDVTILINNAGVLYVKTFQNHSPDEIKRVMDVNIMAHYWTLKAFLPNMIEKDHGHIVALSSVAGLVGAPHGTIYCTTKFAVKAFMESVNEELRMYSKGKSSIKFTTVYPALVLTGLAKKPRIRFPYIMGGLSPQRVASLIIDAQRRDCRESTIPSRWLPMITMARNLPDKAIYSIIDFLGCNFDADE